MVAITGEVLDFYWRKKQNDNEGSVSAQERDMNVESTYSSRTPTPVTENKGGPRRVRHKVQQ